MDGVSVWSDNHRLPIYEIYFLRAFYFTRLKIPSQTIYIFNFSMPQSMPRKKILNAYLLGNNFCFAV